MGNRIERVKKRDGTIVPFNKQKIADAIFKAAQSVGGQDRYLAEDLAEVVRIYLEKEYKGDIPSVEEIQDIVERILIKTGHAKTAKSYILYRQRRARARQIRDGFRPEDLAEREVLERDVSLSVRRSDDRLGLWDKTAIVDALIRETGVSRNIAEVIVEEVEEDVIASKVKNLTSSMIRELVNAKLILYGFEEERLKHSRIGIPFYDIFSIFKSFDGPPDSLSAYLGRRMKREFVMNAIIPQAIVEMHLKGELSIKSIESLDKVLTAYIPVNTFEDLSHLYKKIAPLVEDSLVFSPLDISSLDKSPVVNIPFFVDLPYRLIKDRQMDVKVPSVIRIDSKEEIEAVMKGGERDGQVVSIHKKVRVPLFILNRITLNIPVINAYAEQEGVSLRRRLSDILKGLVDMALSQDAFIQKAPYARKALSSFAGYETTMEIEIDGEGKDNLFQDEGFLSEIFSSGFSVFVCGSSDWLKETLVRAFERDDIVARIKNG